MVETESFVRERANLSNKHDDFMGNFKAGSMTKQIKMKRICAIPTRISVFIYSTKLNYVASKTLLSIM